MSSLESTTQMPRHMNLPAKMSWLSLQVSFTRQFPSKLAIHLLITLTAFNDPVTPPQIHVTKKTERNLDGNGSSDIEEGIPASKGDDEGIFVTRASASYIHALREALGRKILYSAYPKSDGRNKDHQEAGNIVKGVFKDVNNQFCFVTIDEIVYAECSCDDFLVRCSDNAAFSGSTGDFIGYWQNEGFILTD